MTILEGGEVTIAMIDRRLDVLQHPTIMIGKTEIGNDLDRALGEIHMAQIIVEEVDRGRRGWIILMIDQTEIEKSEMIDGIIMTKGIERSAILEITNLPTLIPMVEKAKSGSH